MKKSSARRLLKRQFGCALLVSTDPASNVGQVFGLNIGNRITAIHDVPDLWALEIDPQSPLLRRRASNELREIEAVATQHARRYAVVPLLAEEPVGVERLRKLANREMS